MTEQLRTLLERIQRLDDGHPSVALAREALALLPTAGDAGGVLERDEATVDYNLLSHAELVANCNRLWKLNGQFLKEAEYHRQESHRLAGDLFAARKAPKLSSIENAPKDGSSVLCIYRNANPKVGWEGCEGYFNLTSGKWSLATGYTESPELFLSLPSLSAAQKQEG